MRNGGSILLAVLNFYVRIKILVAKLIIPSLTARSQLLLQSSSCLILQSSH